MPTSPCSSVPEHPREGGLVAVLHGTSAKAKPMLLLGHLDVVEAKRLLSSPHGCIEAWIEPRSGGWVKILRLC